MEETNIAFHLVSFLLALLAAFLLLWVNQERKHSNRLLAFVLVIFAMQNLIFMLIFSKLIIKIPALLRVFAPTTFLAAPMAFVYIRSVLNEELKFRKYDWLFLIPAILTFVNFIPYYLLPIHEKIEYLNNNFYNKVWGQDPAKGFLSSNIYYVIRIFWSGIFLFLGFRLISRFKHVKTKELMAYNKILINWLFIFNSLLTAVWVVIILKLFIPTLKNTHLTISDFLLGVTTLFICLQLFIRPKILYGVYQPSYPVPEQGDIIFPSLSPPLEFVGDGKESKEAFIKEPGSVLSIGEIDSSQYKRVVENLLGDKQSFLNPNYSLDHLVSDTRISRNILSAFINREYGMGFRELLNRYRVKYLIENLDKPEWKQFTLEGIATECGFSSRTTFIKNFKEITGQTPSEYIKKSRSESLS